SSAQKYSPAQPTNAQRGNMDYSIGNKTLPEQITDCLVLVVNPKALPVSLPADTATQINALIKAGDLGNERLSSMLLHEPRGLAAKRLLIINGGTEPLGRQQLIKLAEKAAVQVA